MGIHHVTRCVSTCSVTVCMQHNKTDCGLYMLKNIEKLATHQPDDGLLLWRQKAAEAKLASTDSAPQPTFRAYKEMIFRAQDVIDLRQMLKGRVQSLADE